MKSLPLTLAVVVLLAAPLSAQTGKASFTNRGGSSTAGVTPSPAPAAPAETTVVLKLGPTRVWRNHEDKEIVAELISWPVTDPGAAKKDPAQIKFDIVREGQVRLRKDKQIFVLALDKLSAEDQMYVKQVQQSTARVKEAAAGPAK